MTETEWLTCTDPHKMLAFLRGKAGDRKLRLFAVACCRRIWDFLPTDACRKAVETAERYADGQEANRELSSAWSAVAASAEEKGIEVFDPYEQENIEWGVIPGGSAFMASIELLGDKDIDAAHVASHAALEVAWDASRSRQGKEATRLAFDNDYAVERTAQSMALRDIFGNPFRPVTIDPAWLTCNDGTIPKLAQAIYDERAFDRLPILADALEEAGCSDADILAHCRQPGEHVRGCWIVDLILGKE